MRGVEHNGDEALTLLELVLRWKESLEEVWSRSA